jgi:hypothetical protein
MVAGWGGVVEQCQLCFDICCSVTITGSTTIPPHLLPSFGHQQCLLVVEAHVPTWAGRDVLCVSCLCGACAV